MQPHFGVCFQGRLRTELEAAGVPVYDLGPVRSSRPWTVWMARRRLERLLREHRFDAVVCHMPWSLAIFGPVMVNSGIPLVFWQHRDSSPSHWIERWAARTRPRLVLANSRFTASTTAQVFPNVPVRVVYIPVQLPKPPGAGTREAVRGELHSSSEEVVIIQVSRMHPEKGHELLIRALRELADIPNWSCWIVGGAQWPEERNHLDMLQRMVNGFGLAQRIRFLGQRTDVSQLLAAADIFCQPNLVPEPFGIVFVEALWAGLPIVTTAIGGGVIEIIGESGGLLVPRDDPSRLARALGELIDSRQLRTGGVEWRRNRAASLCDPAARLNEIHEAIAHAS